MLLLLFAFAAATQAFQPATDAPYEEIVSTRFVLASAAPVEYWGQLPFDSVAQVLAATVSSSAPGVFVLSSNDLLFIEFSGSEFTYYPVNLPSSIELVSGSRIASDPATNQLVVVATPTGVFQVDCTVSGSIVACSQLDSTLANFDLVNDLTVASASVNDFIAYIASMNGGFVFRTGSGLVLLQEEPPTSVAFFPPESLLAFGSNSSLTLYVNDTLSRRDWATDLPSASGGVYEAPITSLAFDRFGWLFVGTLACVNIRFPNMTVGHLTRFQGLPYNVTTALAIDQATQNLWVGTPRGAARWNRTSSTWRYFYLQRYLPGQSIVMSLSSALPNYTFVATDGGIALLHSQLWTLVEKAAYLEAVQTRHNRLGLTGDCFLASFGNISSCTNHDNDNNGLWTSLVVAAEAFRFASTQQQDALDNLTSYFEGMRLLNTITGITGLMARSYLPPGQPITSGGVWHNATIDGYEGWIWKGDTSSDEVTGHLFAYPLVAAILTATTTTTTNTTTLAGQAVELIGNIVNYIVSNDFYLIDVTGLPTTWGDWNPDTLNYNRYWSDDRGVNSLQMLAWIVAAINVTGDPTGSLTAAYTELTDSFNQYNENMINLKIEATDDDNYSDDELTFLPYFTYLTNCDDDAKTSYVRLSMARTMNYLRPLRSDLWSAIFAVLDPAAPQSVIDDMIWNLQTWPLEQVDWPTDNSQRQDIFNDPTEPGETLTVLPANERTQMRWNGDPYDLVGGSGYNEFDVGAWLLPYWMARYYGLIV